VPVRTSACPGCGVHLPVTDAFAPDRYNASAECWQLYGELSAYTLTHDDGTFLHQGAVDAYTVQHVGDRVRPITGAFALMGLYLTFERGYTGRQVQIAHGRLAARTKEWPRFIPPPHAGAATVRDVVQTPDGAQRDQMLRQWGAAVWDAWRDDHARIEALVRRFLDERSG